MSNITEGELTSLALCWRIEREDGAGLGLTNHDAPVEMEGATYDPAPGIVPSAVVRSLGLEPCSSEIAGALSTNALDSDDLIVGRWDGAGIALNIIDWGNPEEAPLPLIAGRLGEAAVEGEGFSAELNGAATKLQAPVCPSTSPECRAQFGDKHCRIDLAGRHVRAKVQSSENGALQLDRTVDERFLFGRLRFLSGDNCGMSSTIIGVSGNTVRVRDIPRASIQPDCLVELREGCDKRLATCADRFGNAINFRGEPHLPGNDLLTRYPGA